MTNKIMELAEKAGMLIHEGAQDRVMFDGSILDALERFHALAIDAYKAKLLEGVGEPVAKYWAHPTGRTRITVQGSVINADATWQVTHLLYTADQLAAAVAKERERCLFECCHAQSQAEAIARMEHLK